METVTSVANATSALLPLLMVVAFLWVILRTGSRHVLFRRIWQLVHGNQEISDPAVRAFVEEQSSLASFRMFSGLQVASLDEARRLLDWAKQCGVQMRTLSICGDYFDTELLQVRAQKLPGRGWQFLKLVRAFLMFLALVACTFFAPSDRLLLTLKATDRDFLATTTEASRAWSWGAPPLRVSQCSESPADLAKRTGFTEQEIDILCPLMKEEGFSSYWRDSLKSQRWTLVALMALAIWSIWASLASWARAETAKNLMKRDLRGYTLGVQLQLDLRS